MTYEVESMKGATLYAKLLVGLIESPTSIQDLAEYSGLHYRTVQRYVRAMHEAKVVHIADWALDGTNHWSIKLWQVTMTKQKDKRKPYPYGPKLNTQTYRVRKRGPVSSVFQLGSLGRPCSES